MIGRPPILPGDMTSEEAGSDLYYRTKVYESLLKVTSDEEDTQILEFEEVTTCNHVMVTLLSMMQVKEDLYTVYKLYRERLLAQCLCKLWEQ